MNNAESLHNLRIHPTLRYRSPQLCHLVCLGDTRRSVRYSQRSPKPIAENKDLTVVVNVVRVMDRVVFAPHDGIDVPIHGVVDVGSPNGSEEQQAEVGQVMTGDEGQHQNIRAGLQHAIEGVKGDGRPGCERLGTLVLMMKQMDVFVQKLVGMKCAVHPIAA
jgi:hypothetical protein